MIFTLARDSSSASRRALPGANIVRTFHVPTRSGRRVRRIIREPVAGLSQGARGLRPCALLGNPRDERCGMDIRFVLLMTNTFARNSLAARKANAGEKDGRKSNTMESPLRCSNTPCPHPPVKMLFRSGEIIQLHNRFGTCRYDAPGLGTTYCHYVAKWSRASMRGLPCPPTTIDLLLINVKEVTDFQ